MKYLCSFLLVLALVGCADKSKAIKLVENDFQPIKNISDLETLNEYEVIFVTNYKDYGSVTFASSEKQAIERMAADIAGQKMYCVRGTFIPASDVREIRVFKLSTRGLTML